MKLLKEILGNDKDVWFDIEKKDWKAFLKFAKDNGCKWLDGSEIDLKKHTCSYHMGISKEKTLGFVSMHCWFLRAVNEPRKIKFKDII